MRRLLKSFLLIVTMTGTTLVSGNGKVAAHTTTSTNHHESYMEQPDTLPSILGEQTPLPIAGTDEPQPLFIAETDGFIEVFSDTITSTSTFRPEWYPNPAAISAPNGNNLIVGSGGNIVRTLNLNNLPTHSKVRLSFDFYMLQRAANDQPWYGTYNVNPIYHHHFKLDTSTTPATDLDYTFCNVENSGIYQQSYPIANSTCMAGDPVLGSLGYPDHGSFKSNVRYRLSVLIDHTQSTFDAQFTGTNGYNNKSPLWGIDNIQVEIKCETCSSPPMITAQPQSLILKKGETAHFAVQVTGALPLTFQWYRINKEEHGPISGALEATYTIPDVNQNDNGKYYVVVSNAYGSTTSTKAILGVRPGLIFPSGLSLAK